jgi:dTDP-4-dehydrorhamnose 3,5-epimerase
MELIETEIPDVKVLVPKKFGDERGFFSETYNHKTIGKLLGQDLDFVQDNHAFSAAKGVVRGLHYQLPPMAQGKLVRVTRGAIHDVAVDIRKGSPTFGKHVRRLISAENWHQIWVPPGFAHGYATLEPNTEVLYKVTNYYSPKNEAGIRWNDSAIGIEWGVDLTSVILSGKDAVNPMLSEATRLF